VRECHGRDPRGHVGAGQAGDRDSAPDTSSRRTWCTTTLTDHVGASISALRGPSQLSPGHPRFSHLNGFGSRTDSAA
jgi:hypothetical protein